MICPICSHERQFYFFKDFDKYGLGKVEYHKCVNCGFVLSETHSKLTEQEWSRLNNDYHASYQGNDLNVDDPRWVERLQAQAAVLADAADIGLLVDNGDWLDYACGDGKLSVLLESRKKLLNFDKFMHQPGYLEEAELIQGRFDFVITTSVFEHFLQRAHFNEVNKLVSSEGVMGLHTLVCGQVPCDPDWFYLLPVHCAFHTNKSMSILLDQWSYIESVYNLESRLWLCFKPGSRDVESIVERANKRLNAPRYIYKNGFVDYWK